MAEKKVFSRIHIDMYFLQKTEFEMVKFGPCGPIYILQTPIGGSHPVPCLSTQIAERQGTAMYYPSAWDKGWHKNIIGVFESSYLTYQEFSQFQTKQYVYFPLLALHYLKSGTVLIKWRSRQEAAYTAKCFYNDCETFWCWWEWNIVWHFDAGESEIPASAEARQHRMAPAPMYEAQPE